MLTEKKSVMTINVEPESVMTKAYMAQSKLVHNDFLNQKIGRFPLKVKGVAVTRTGVDQKSGTEKPLSPSIIKAAWPFPVSSKP